MKHLTKNIYAILLMVSCWGCGKEFLDVKADKSQLTPSSIADFQAMMDNISYLMNIGSSHMLGIIGSDEYYITDERYQTFPVQNSGLKVSFQKNAYAWSKFIYEGGETTDWGMGYARILWSNVVLDGLDQISPSPAEQGAWNNAKGCALFHRSLNYYHLAQLYCKAYTAASADRELGLPLRNEAGITVTTPRASLQNTYAKMVEDMEQAADLLPEKALTIYRPGKAAAYAMLSRLFMQMGDYGKAAEFSGRSLVLHGQLIDFNSINLNLSNTFTARGLGNPEILFMNTASSILIANTTRFNADRDLLNSYSADDLRRQAYWLTNTDSRILFKGSYNGDVLLFSGLATNEVYLNHAESLTRTGKLEQSLSALNTLMVNRYRASTFQPFNSGDQETILRRIIDERRKELVLRGTRWEDLRRLNKEPRFAKPLNRVINGITHELLPNDQRYAWPIPPEAIALGGYEQNSR